MQNPIKIAVLNSYQFSKVEPEYLLEEKVQLCYYDSTNSFLEKDKNFEDIDAIILYANIIATSGSQMVTEIRNQLQLKYKPLVVMGTPINKTSRNIAIELKVDDIFQTHANYSDILFRIKFLIPSKKRICEKEIKEFTTQLEYSIKWDKRLFDIFFSGLALIILSPLFLIISILILLSSKGPIFYSSKRIGAGYKAFDFYKFRSMIPDADTRLKEVAHLNQYNTEVSNTSNVESINTLCTECIEREIPCQAILFKDGDAICEKLHKKIQKDVNGAAFLKVKGDPRITKIGQFIRNTSIDELPQLFNVLKGDMSIVGNRPLPMYEAEKITTDQFITRFMAPAGITGLWQVNKRGKGKMSQEERIELDNIYARNHSLVGDIKIILKTIPALLQKESV